MVLDPRPLESEVTFRLSIHVQDIRFRFPYQSPESRIKCPMSPAGQKGGHWQHAQVRLLQLSMDEMTVHAPTPWNDKDNFYAGSFGEGTP
jgi:hypothetical protein